MKSWYFFIIFFCIGLFLLGGLNNALAIGIFGYFVAKIILESTSVFAFRELALFLYSLNYLFSPAITYQFDQATMSYPMKIVAGDYFPIAIPGFLCLYLGMHLFKTRIFNPRIEYVKRDAKNNESLLIKFVIIGVLLRLFGAIFPSDLAFFVYLLSSIRFVGAFALFSTNSIKYGKWVAALLLLELYYAALAAMYHDAIMWILFFALFFAYTMKPSFKLRLLGVSASIVFILFIQGLKSAYRGKIHDSETSDLGLVLETSAEVRGDIGSDNNILNSLNRGNQAWIFASTKERMDRIGDYQGLHILGIYAEAALLPRFLARDKLKSGDRQIFNTFSGHYINENTSMGLGVFADGYIANGFWGVMLFSFGLGLLFNLTFIIIESWARLSEFYVLMVLPLLNYAIRPDCELQTTINHLVKGLVLFGILVSLTKYTFIINNDSLKSLKIRRGALSGINSVIK